MTKYGYIRVSSKDQNPERQLEALIAYGIKKENIVLEYMSGKNFERPKYKALMKKLERGDVLVVKSIDRLGRNYNDTLDQWRILCRDKEVDIEVIDFPLLNTNQTRNGLTGRLISDMTLQILAYFAQVEREFIHQRQAEGIAVAKARGVTFGARKKPLPPSFEEAYFLCKNGKMTFRESAKMAGMSTSTFYRRFYEKEQEGNCTKM